MSGNDEAKEAECQRLQARLRGGPGWSVGTETARYILGQLGDAGKPVEPFLVFASDARTGRPLHGELNPAWLEQ